MRINSIKQDNQGFKLISASKIINQPGLKPIVGHTVYFDYKENTLRQFNGNNFTEINCNSFKCALKYIYSI